jgi:hypothetical protein
MSDPSSVCTLSYMSFSVFRHTHRSTTREDGWLFRSFFERLACSLIFQRLACSVFLVSAPIYIFGSASHESDHSSFNTFCLIVDLTMDSPFLDEVKIIAHETNSWESSDICTPCKLYPGDLGGPSFDVDLSTCIGNKTRPNSTASFVPFHVRVFIYSPNS